MQIPIDHYASGEYLYDQMCAPVCQKYSLTHMEFVVLMFLANNPGFDTAAQIVRYRRLTKSHVSLAVRALLERRLLIGVDGVDDRRTIHLSLTEDAEEIVLAGRNVQKEFFNVIFKGFSQEDRDRMGEFMNRIDENIKSNIK